MESTPAFFRFSDLLRKTHTQNEQNGAKGKGKAVVVDLATNLLENVNKAQEELQYNLITFQQILNQTQGHQQFVENEIREIEYGYDIDYNNLPISYYYEDFPDSDSDDTCEACEEVVQNFYPEKLENFDKDWLLKQCELHNSAFGGALDPIKLCTDIFTILRSDKDGMKKKNEDDEIQTELVDLLGYENFEFVTTLVTKRAIIVDNIQSQSEFLLESRENRENRLELSEKNSYSSLGEQKRPEFGSQAFIKYEDEEKEKKRLQKEYKKKRKQLNTENQSAKILGFDTENLNLIREQQLRETKDTCIPPQRTKSSDKFKHIYGNTQSGSVLSIFGTKFSLPVGSKRDEFQDYEEITVPMTKTTPPIEGEQLIYVNEMDNLCKGTFEDYKSLNRVQSIVYPVAYQKNDNLLICAPTGAGKTDIALLAILRTVYQHCTPTPLYNSEPQNFNIKKNDFKIVYIAPMKALAAEIVGKLSRRLKWLGIQVRELTGDMQLTKTEISETQILITTPEKWDVVTRKSTGDVELTQKVKLLIIDEVHLLHDDRGSVLESLVARTRRQVETIQSVIRIVGLSATLPNYVDVALFLGVDLNNVAEGLFYFDAGFRPVPLEQHYIGIKGKPGSIVANTKLNRVCWEKVLEVVKKGCQVMVFVHARKETVKTAKALIELVKEEECGELFDVLTHPQYESKIREVSKSRNNELKELFKYSFGIHHAGMARPDRSMTERLFESGLIKVLCCTATLAWGVNLPAHAVIIKGTQVYDTQKGKFVDISILDVMQIFGRAGRPSKETHGVGYILASHDKLSHYVSAMTQQHPIESKFAENIVDNLNAEISLGTVSSIDEGVSWLGYTYLFVRMKKEPFVYGMSRDDLSNDPELVFRRRDLIMIAARKLANNKMISIEDDHYFTSTNSGRIASNYYIKYTSIEIFNANLKDMMTEGDILTLISKSSEFNDLKSREEESKELTNLKSSHCHCNMKSTPDSTEGKVNILLQAYLSRARIEDFALVSDSAYVAQNATRIARALFELALDRNLSHATSKLLEICKCIDKRMWMFETPLSQFGLPPEIIMNLQEKSPNIEWMRDMQSAELGELVHNKSMGSTISRIVERFPLLKLDAQIFPITRSILRVTLYVTPDFVWQDSIHGSVEPWWILIDDNENPELYHSEYFILRKKHLGETQKLGFTIAVQEPLPSQIYIKVVSDRWIGAGNTHPVSLNNIVLPEHYNEHTELLDLKPIPVSRLKDKVLEEICAKRFSHFNPVQTQVFDTLYNSSSNALIGAPTGSGKTVIAELAMWWAFREFPKSKVVYIAPLKALVRERVDDWNSRLTEPMQRRLVELTGDVTPDLRSIENADIIITTPEKWDGISRSWQHRNYVKLVSLVIIDEIHLLGGDRGPTIEAIVSRMNYIGSQTDKNIRIVGLSTALANAQDLAEWLNIDKDGLFNFRHSVRPVPLDIHIEGFSGKHYCPRMATMNKPAFSAIMRHSPSKPVIVFVSSRRQTRLTAQDLITYCCMTENPYHFLRMPEEELQMLLTQIKDSSMKMSLTFGIGLHHAGLTESDRKIVEELFLHQKIQVLVATSTLAWGVNLPAHLVVIKGTEFYDAKSKGFVDFPLTDILQMMGRAGRPQFDTSGVACIFVQESKQNFYKKFLFEPFPVESSFHMQLENHLNAEIVAETIKSKKDAKNYLIYTFLYRRLQKNPTYYGTEDYSPEAKDKFLSQLLDKSINELQISGCIDTDDNDCIPTSFGKIASVYYLSHKTIRIFRNQIHVNSSIQDLLITLCDAEEYSELPVRHNEDLINIDLEKMLKWPVQNHLPYDNPHVKAFLLLQARLGRIKLPIADYVTDTMSVLDQAIRILQAMIEFTVEQKMLTTSLNIMSLVQCIKQARYPNDSSLTILPGIDTSMVDSISNKGQIIRCIGDLLDLSEKELKDIFKNVKNILESEIKQICQIISNIPSIYVYYNQADTTKNSFITKQECNFEIVLERKNMPSNYDGRIYTPKFPKVQYESWWLILGDVNTDNLIDMKRINIRTGPKEEITQKITNILKSVAPEKEGKYKYDVFLISDGYMGIDQQYDIEFVVENLN
ncbi:8101_t:CDS:10 [Diversispora eburnea]|uniref:8101_t:CDS:1 n=1 Tax=Diversispora eburnea TaxID=1213867 RepID=A0A9N8ZAH7_9GLOM|nr:8101_t:CDS:10 [Diversispora eburnea]